MKISKTPKNSFSDFKKKLPAFYENDDKVSRVYRKIFLNIGALW